MASSWDVKPLGDLVEDIFDRRGVTPLKLGSDFTSYGHRVVSAKSVRNRAIDVTADDPRYIDDVTYAKWMKTPLRQDDVVLTSEAPLGEPAYLASDVDWALGQRLFGIRTDKTRLHGRYLYYALQADPIRADLMSRATGTTVTGVRQSELRKVGIPLPPLPEQRRIAHILGTLDDKIELNRRMNETLEEMARALFKSWFVDFDPVRAKAEGRDPGLPPHLADLFPDRLVDSELGEIPAGWCAATIGSVAEVIDCLHSMKPERKAAGWPLLQLNNIRSDGLLDMQDAYLIDRPDYDKWTSRMEPSPGDCVITNVGRVGAVAQVPQGFTGALGRNMTGLRSTSDFRFPTFLLECLLSSAMSEEIARKTDAGTILNALNVRSVPKLRFARGPASVVAVFERHARPLRARMGENLAESRALSLLKDTLLPRLLSGEIGAPCGARRDLEG